MLYGDGFHAVQLALVLLAIAWNRGMPLPSGPATASLLAEIRRIAELSSGYDAVLRLLSIEKIFKTSRPAADGPAT
ncbi:MAG: hypothetical protein IPL61_09605 [Myxococcales bacterium]|nr:hypothetical protein [Myxococcales bacterium]